MEKRRNPEIIAGRVNADGTIATGDGFTVVKGGVTVYTLYFPSGFRLISITTAPASGYGQASISSPAERSVQINTGDVAGGGADRSFTFIAVGVQQ